MSKTAKTKETGVNLVRQELAFMKEENEKLLTELRHARKELALEKDEKGKRAAELGIANKELVYQDEEKEKRAAELETANIGLASANRKLLLQNAEKEKRAAELIIANDELVFQNQEKENRAAELIIANDELAYQNQEKEQRAEEKGRRAAELVIANEELLFQNEEKEKRAAELVIANAELLFQNGEKEKRAAELEEKNKEVEAAKSDIEKKTKQLEVSSKYKSEFLANMSHELRTPLNSLLILSKDLSENKKCNLTPDQVESSEIIYKSGHDLLVLINEVLDLSKIEAGKMTLNVENVYLKPFMEDLIRGFRHSADQKGLRLNANLDIALPDFIITDAQRLKQILKNLVSNAIKFTDKGSVDIRLNRNSESAITISVTDTGIGIQDSNQMAVFEAFQQADGTTSRKYGGTGLGLSISRELAKLLGGGITLASVIDKGSTFSVVIPIRTSGEVAETDSIGRDGYNAHSIVTAPLDEKFLNYPSIKDDRANILPQDKVVLIIEDDLKFAGILAKLAAEKGFRFLNATTGEDGILLATNYLPDAIILDIGLPGMKGHDLLLKLKSDTALRHIPVHIMSGNDTAERYLQDGAVEVIMKPVSKDRIVCAFTRIERHISRKIRNLLLVEDDQNSRKAMKVLIGNDNVNYLEAANGEDALHLCGSNEIDCMILDIDLPDMNGIDLIRRLETAKGCTIPKIIVYTGMDLSLDQKEKLKKYTSSIIQKAVESDIALLKETALFLQRTSIRPREVIHSPQPVATAEPSPGLSNTTTGGGQEFFHGKKILLVDDDYRNVFALSRILTDRGMVIVKAENGIVALEKLAADPEIELVLMDIMMPEMDGYEAMRRIRVQESFMNLPVIAVTAKAMSYDQQKCLDAGANAYITKPVEIDELMLMMRMLICERSA